MTPAQKADFLKWPNWKMDGVPTYRAGNLVAKIHWRAKADGKKSVVPLCACEIVQGEVGLSSLAVFHSATEAKADVWDAFADLCRQT